MQEPEMPTERCIEIWMKRFFTSCIKCDTLLMPSNAYERGDTMSHMHKYCKPCYIEIQSARNASYVKLPKQVFVLINNKKRIVMFDSEDEKQKYLRDRRSLEKFSRSCEEYNSIVGCSEDWGTGEKLACDQCGGLLRYDDHGYLVCQVCFLISDNVALSLERNISFDKKPKPPDKYEQFDGFFNDVADTGGCFDFFYSRAMSKYNRSKS